MLNGSVLLTARMVGPPYLSKPGKLSDRRRGFARSDDGGRTWAEWWFLEDRQPDIGAQHSLNLLQERTVLQWSPARP